MEEGAVGVARFLAVLDLPLGLIAMVIGLVTAIRMVPRAGTPPLADLGLLERIAVGLCAAVAALGLLGFLETVVQKRPDFPPLAMLFVGSILGCGWPALAWKSRWRGVAEGAATVFIAMAAILAGFSIGFMFVPLVALMIWVCVLRLFRRFRGVSDATPSRVDSLP